MRKSSLNFTFGKDGSRKSDLIRPNSSKHVFLEISEDWRQSYLITTLRDILAVVITQIQGRTQELCYIYNKCFQKRVKVYLFVHLFIYLFIFYFLLLQRDIFFNLAEFLHFFLDCHKFVFQHVKSSCLAPAKKDY